MSANSPESGKNGNAGEPETANNAKNGNSGKALVLGGGGVTGIAWEIGLLYGLAEAGVDLSDADLFIGTSAGSVVSTLVASGEPLHQLYNEQLAPASSEIGAQLGRSFVFRWMLATMLPGSPQQVRARLGRAALRTKTVPEATRRAVIASRIHDDTWPNRRLLVTAVDAESGEPAIFDRDSGVSLVDAVAASCAVPLIWPPITINGHRYVDGGVRTVANVDLAKGCGRVVVIAPLADAFRREDRPASQLQALGPDVRTALISPEAAALQAIGKNVLDPAHRADAAHAGYGQAASALSQVRAAWE